MKRGRRAFTLLEVMIAVSILSLMMIFLYKSYATLNISNQNLQKETVTLDKTQKIKKIIYLDFLTALPNTVAITKRDKKEDFVSLQTAHSLHQRFHPYVTYMLKNENLYRLESLKQIKTYELSVDDKFDVDKIEGIKTFRIYKFSDANNEKFLIDVKCKEKSDILLKINIL